MMGFVPPSDFTAIVVNDNDVQMSWSEITDALSYKVYRDDVEIATLSTNSYTDTSLPDGFYRYSVSAVYTETESYKTKPVEVLVGDCAIEFNLYDSYGDGWNGAFLTVSFDNGDPSVDYTVENSNSSAQYTCVISGGVMVTLIWTSGSYDSECSFDVRYKGGDVIYASNGTPSAGVIMSFDSCPTEYSINIEDGIEDGTITVEETAPEGSEVTVIATPDGGYGISSLYYYTTDPDEKNDIDIETMTFIMPAADVTIGATFAPITYTITAVIDPAEGGTANGEGLYDYGDVVTVSVELNDNYVFESWTENEEVVSTDLEYSFTVTSDRNLVAKVNFYDDINEVNGITASIYPNPIDDKLSVICNEDMISISLFTITGNVLFTESDIVENSFVADVSDLAPGTYILRIETNQGIVHRKIAKR